MIQINTRKHVVIFFTFMLINLIFYNSAAHSNKKATNKELTIYKFYSPECPACQRNKNIFQEISPELKDKVECIECNIQESSTDDLINEKSLEIYALPTYIFIKDDQVVLTKRGATTKEELEPLIKNCINK